MSFEYAVRVPKTSADWVHLGHLAELGISNEQIFNAFASGTLHASFERSEHGQVVCALCRVVVRDSVQSTAGRSK